MSVFTDLKNELLDIIKHSSNEATSAYDTQATVVRTDEDTIWVHIPGGVAETPVRKTVDAKEGDEIQIRVGGGRAWAVGNATAPPTDDRTAVVAQNTANEASQVADKAREMAESAEQAATTAWNYADSAHEAADTAWNHANSAYSAAVRANTSANDALIQLSTVEDVVDTLNWVTEHGTMTKTTDTAIDPTHVYFVRDNNGDYVVGSNHYRIVTEPKAEELSTYYVLSIDEAVSNYVTSHLALTNEGLYVVKDNQGYKVLLANDGLKIYDNQGHLVSTFGESITFDSSRPQRIGNDSTYIKWYDSNNDQIPDSIEISGSNVSIADSVIIGGMPTKVSDLTNDSGFQTASDVSSAITTGVSGKADKTAAIGNVTTKDQYYLSTSSSSATGGSWGDSVPTWSSGKYIWTRVATTKTPVSGSATTTYSTAVYDSALTTALSTANTANTLASAAATKTDAIARYQRIYWRATSASGKPGINQTWLATSGTGYGNWSLSIPQMTSGTTKYPYLYTAVQSQTVAQQAAGTACSCSEVLLDDTTTVIDGGNIITGTVTANKLNASDINASKSLTVGAMTDAAAATILNSNIQIGGRNLLLDTNAPSLTKVASEANRYWSSNSTLASDGTATFVSISDPPSKGITYGIKLDCTTSGTRWHGLAFYNTPNTAKMTFEAGKTYTQSVYIRVASGTANQCQITSQDQTSYGVTAYLFTPTAEWQRYSRTFTPTSTGTQKVVYFEMRYQNIGSVEMCGFQIEEGNKATTWTPAPEDVDANIDDAAKTATNYLTTISGVNGITVHNASDTNNFAAFNSNGMQVYKGGNTDAYKVASFGDTVQIGKTSASHSIIDTDGQRIYGRDGTTLLAHIGYGEGATESGTDFAPYFTFGTRAGTIGADSFAEGYSVTASGEGSHAEGNYAQAKGNFSHAEGVNSIADGNVSHAEGFYTNAVGLHSHAQNSGTYAAKQSQTAIGRYNVEDEDTSSDYGKYALIIGNGVNDEHRSNAFTVDWDGNLEIGANSLADFIVEQGTSNIWTYRVWKSGVKECFGKYSASIAITTSSAQYGGYRSGQLNIPQFPVTFTSAPVITATAAAASGYWVNNVTSSTTGGTFYLSMGASSSATTRYINFHVIGK